MTAHLKTMQHICLEIQEEWGGFSCLSGDNIYGEVSNGAALASFTAVRLSVCQIPGAITIQDVTLIQPNGAVRLLFGKLDIIYNIFDTKYGDSSRTF